MSMSSLDNLKGNLSVFIDLSSGWEFFVGIRDYVNYINNTPELKSLVSNLEKDRETLLVQDLPLEKITEKELLNSLTKIRVIITKNKLEADPEIAKIIYNIESYLNPSGGLSMSGEVSDNLNNFLFDICRSVPEEKRFILFKQFINKNPVRKNIYGNFTFSGTLEKRRALTAHIKHRDSIELWWSSWLKLSKVPTFIEADSIYKVELKDGDVKYAYELIKAREEYDNTGRGTAFAKLIPEYKSLVLRVQEFLRQGISQNTSEQQEKGEEEKNKPEEDVTLNFPEQLSLSQRDRQIWVNDSYFLSKPNWTGGNIEFFEYLMENSSKTISREELPKGLANVIRMKRFPKILVALGFKGEILKAFCSKRGEDRVLFLKTVSRKDLLSRGINLAILMRELELAHLRNSPE